MIELSLAGGLGNQMFEYAYARALSEEFGDPEIIINPYYNSYYKLYVTLCVGSSYAKYHDYQLDLFELNPNVTKITAARGLATGLLQIVPGSLIRYGIYRPNTTSEKFERITRNGKYKMQDREFTYYEHSKICKKNRRTVLGWFQSEKYFLKIRPILLKEFQFKAPPSPKNQDMLAELSSCNSVCVHIRRGDMLLQHNQYVTRPGENFYTEGIKYIAERINDPVFYIFSNRHEDLEWIKNSYKFEFPVRYVDFGNEGYDDMRLMYNCKHFVISKSTFSWWGSYMSQNPDKIVVVPELGMGSETWLKDENMDDFYRADMVKIRADPEAMRSR